jgi:hypothetical protein
MGTKIWITVMPERSNGVPMGAGEKIVCLTSEPMRPRPMKS